MRRALIAGLLCLLAALSGCIYMATELMISPESQEVTISAEIGYAVAAWDLRGNGDVLVTFGDMTKAVYRLDRGVAVDIEHEYTATGTYRVVATQGSRTDAATVMVTVDAPQVAAPFYTSYLVDDGERIDFNIPRRRVGCDNGVELYHSGVTPGVGVTEFRIFAYDHSGNKISLFDSSGRYVWGEWIPLVEDLRELQIITCWAGWTGTEPKIPMASKAVEPAGCGGGCDDGTAPWIPPSVPDSALRIVFTLEARNQWITTEGLYPRVDWRIAVLNGGCR